jgi:hypothetical protein
VIVDTGGVSASVNVRSASGATPTLYADVNGLSPISNPVAVAGRSTFYVPGPGSWVVNNVAVTLETGQVATVTLASALGGMGGGYYPAGFGWYSNPAGTGATANAGQADIAFLNVPFFSGSAGITIDQLDMYVTVVGAAGANTRAGLYRITNQADPFAWRVGAKYADLIVDGGAVATDAGTGQKTWTLSPLVIPANTWFAVAAVDHSSGALATRFRWLGNTGGTSPFGVLSSIAYSANNPPGICVYQSGVTTVLPATFTPVNTFGIYDCGIGIHRSA